MAIAVLATGRWIRGLDELHADWSHCDWCRHRRNRRDAS
jgi:hypothetical protein